ncbi:MAG: Crp/Fnr family transcriptional regulator [Oscillospiraceae bacterium]|nr:Crp/Fnr family transcriptional regulator [Oscillospiraceae bacterium]MBQ9929614.1 Crp/Fnr family transcriptional regulator [Oscillospiraceae bacterium]
MEFTGYLPIWEKLTREQQDRIAQVIEFHTVKKGTHIHDSSAQCLGLVLIKSGQLRAYILSEDGREITIGRMFEYDVSLLSASCVMPDLQFNVMIEAEKDTQFWSIPACLFKNLMDESLAVSNYARNLLSSNFSDLMWLMEQIMWKSFDKRLAGFLLEEMQLEGSSILKITHEKIAAHMGTAREVVTRMLRYFQNEGMVRLTRGTIEILSQEKLEDLSDT